MPDKSGAQLISISFSKPYFVQQSTNSICWRIGTAKSKRVAAAIFGREPLLRTLRPEDHELRRIENAAADVAIEPSQVGDLRAYAA
ncbi:MAG: hypothetical protein WBD71_14705 [Xanthobacteraceae bacterium]